MKFFVDTAEIGEIKELASTGLLDGVTTNPSLILKSGRNLIEVIGEICQMVPGPVSAEVAATDYETMMAEANKLRKIARNVAIKVPLTVDGLKACKTLSDQGTMVNVTLCFTANQALLAAKAGATFISPFVGRLEEIKEDGMQVVRDIVTIYRNYGFKTQVLTASVRNVEHVRQAALAGSHVATISPAILKQLYQHPLTDKGLAKFIEDWQKTGQKIL